MEKVEKRKKILIITQHFHPENFRINDIALEWVKRGYEVEAVTAIPNYPQGRFFDGYGLFKKRTEEWNGIKIHHLPLIPSGNNPIQLILNYYSFPFVGFFWSLFTKIECDYVFMFETSPMHQCKIGVHYAKRKKVPLYLYAQDLWPESFEMITEIHSPLIIAPLNRMVDKIYKACDHIFVTSESARRAVIERKHPVPEDKVHFLPQYAEELYKPLDRSEARKSGVVTQIPDDDSFKVIFTGNIGYAQGLDILPKLANMLKKEKCNVKFVIVGDGRYREKFVQEMGKSGCMDMFILTGRQPAEDIPSLLAVCDMAFISYKRHFLFDMMIPAKLQSYLACGMPVLGAANGETKNIIESAACGYCSALGDVDALERNLREAIRISRDEPDKLREMSKNALAYSREHFDKKTILNELDRYFQIC